MLELLAPAGSPEGVVAAVQNGADAVYVGFGNFNARKNAKNFTEQEFMMAAEYCRIRGVKIYVTLNTLISDRELPQVAEAAKRACRYGADAILVQDLGVLRAVRQVVPDMPIHASTQMSIHNLEGVKLAAAAGMSRVVLARELPKADIEYICKNSPIEIEVFTHGALCMCYSGQCYMSSLIGRRSGNRGLCAQPCRLQYHAAKGSDHPMSLKDNCLIQHIKELEDAGVKCLKIEGRMRRPEYSAIVTGIYSRVIKENHVPTEEEMDTLRVAFSRDGFTDGYFTNSKGPGMLGVRLESDKGDSTVFASARKNYLNGEFQRVPIRFVGLVRKGETAKIVATDDRGNMATAEGDKPEIAFHKELDSVSFQTQLYKTGGTPFYCDGVKSSIEPGLALSLSTINEMRRKLLSEMLIKRKSFEPRIERPLTLPPRVPNLDVPPELTMSVVSLGQLSEKLAALNPRVLYVPLEEMRGKTALLTPFLQNPQTEVSVILPRVIHDSEREEVADLLRRAKEYGITTVLTGNIGHIVFVRSLGFEVRGDFGLNVYNSLSLDTMKELGLKSSTLSFELRYEQIRDISKSIPTELIIYGRLPLMITETCIIKNCMGVCSCDNFTGLTDQSGFSFPVAKAFGCRNVVYNSKKLYLADKAADYSSIGVWGTRLCFTTENPLECVSVTERYLGLGTSEPSSYTRGLYYRGVE